MTTLDEAVSAYKVRYPILEVVSLELKKYMSQVLFESDRIDSISVRAKSPDRFAAKCKKQNADGDNKYRNPLFEVQDQIGARVNVLYLSDIEIIKKTIEKYFKYIELQEKSPSSNAEFGYFGVHFILKVPDDVIPDGTDNDNVPDFFELQIKTIFQHAWSECHHDLGYKSIRDLTSEEKRKMAFTAAQAWGADKIFEELSNDLSTNDNSKEDANSTPPPHSPTPAAGRGSAR